MAEAEETEETPAKKGGNKLIVILMVLIIVLLLAVVGVGAWLLLGKSSGHDGAKKQTSEQTKDTKAAEHKPKAAPITIPISQPITVNLNKPNAADLLQVQLSLVTYDAGVDALVKENRAEIINDVMLVLSDVNAADLRTRAGKVALQAKLKDAINKIIAERSGKKNAIEDVFFTKLLMQ